jgi:Flp pilus assembly pilin Flp
MTPAPGWIRKRLTALRAHASRGATLVEYALVTSLVLVGLLAVLDRLQAAGEAEIDNQAACIERRPSDECQLTPVTAPDPDAPPVTFSPPGPPPPADAIALSINVESQPDAGGWLAIFTIEVELQPEGDDTTPLEPVLVPDVVVNLQVNFLPTPSPSFFPSCTTDADGTCTFELNVPGDVSAIRVTSRPSPPIVDLPDPFTVSAP